jgi:hypothetical protein
VVEGGSNIITSDKGSLQLTTQILPEIATNKSVSWSVVNITGQAAISTTGLVTAIEDGLVTVLAFAADGSGVKGTLDINIRVNDPLVVMVNENRIRVPLEGNYKDSKLSLYDLQGHLIEIQNVDGNLSEFDISALPPGIYIVVLSRSIVLKVAKVIIHG